MSYAIFKKNGVLYYIETNLPVGYELIDEDMVKLHLKAMDMAVFSFKQSKNSGWDVTTKDTAFFHALKLHDKTGFLYSGLKWFFYIKLLESLGFKFMDVIPEAQLSEAMYPLVEVR